MSKTHDYRTQITLAKNLRDNDVLVGESGGLSAVYDAYPSSYMSDTMCLETEHGALYLDAEAEVEILHRDGQ